jgi:spore maturation protein CgeB
MPKILLFCHSLRSDWNHGNAHFLRGLLSECLRRGIDVTAMEPADCWSARNLVQDCGNAALEAWRAAYPLLPFSTYDPARLDLDRALDNADVVLVHEWNQSEIVASIARHRRLGGDYLLFFHDTHHRMASAPESLAAFDLDGFDGVLAFGESLRQAYVRRGWGEHAFRWHEAADLALCGPRPEVPRQRDLVWIGNWGDEERSIELREFLIEPVARVGLSARVHGVRYPPAAQRELARAGIEFAGYLPNFRVPEAFAEAWATVHIPRRPYARLLPGIPTIRVFEALACGIPLVSAPWDDCEGLFRPGHDFLFAADGQAMCRQLTTLREDRDLASALAINGRAVIEARHSCAHRLDELVAICRRLGRDLSPLAAVAAE